MLLKQRKELLRSTYRVPCYRQESVLLHLSRYILKWKIIMYIRKSHILQGRPPYHIIIYRSWEMIL